MVASVPGLPRQRPSGMLLAAPGQCPQGPVMSTYQRRTLLMTSTWSLTCWPSASGNRSNSQRLDG
eukprot:4913907-Prorocentrum_lima.AAC.1